MNTELTNILLSAKGNPTPPRPSKVCTYPVAAALAAVPVEYITDNGALDWFAQMVHDVVEVIAKPMLSFSFEFCGGLCSEDEDFGEAEEFIGIVSPAEFEIRRGNTVHKMASEDFYLVKWYDEGINGFFVFRLVSA